MVHPGTISCRDFCLIEHSSHNTKQFLSMNLQFREATPRDAEAIALLHAESWRTTYRGMLNDAFFEQNIVANRLSVWQQRFHTSAEHQFVLLAEEGEELYGFICLFGGADGILGSFVENLHVSPKMQGQGIGCKLLVQAGQWVQTHLPHSTLYLWVYKTNHAARRFYERLAQRCDPAALRMRQMAARCLNYATYGRMLKFC